MATTHYYKTVQLSQLRTFCLAATEGNFTRTARALGLSVPTVWQQVRALEEQMDAPLLRRRGRALELTQEGRVLLELIQPHVDGIDSLLPSFKVRCANVAQPLTVASTHYLISYHLPRPVREFARLLPAVRLKLLSAPWVDVVHFVERGEADLGLASYNREEPRSPRLDYENVLELQFTLLTAHHHPLAGHKRVRLADLVKYPLILGARESYGRKLLERLLAQHDLLDRAHVVMESQSTDNIVKYVANGVGITALYTGREVAQQVPPVHFRVFDPSLPPLPVAIISRKGAHLPPPADAFRRLLHRSFAATNHRRQN